MIKIVCVILLYVFCAFAQTIIFGDQTTYDAYYSTDGWKVLNGANTRASAAGVTDSVLFYVNSGATNGGDLKLCIYNHTSGGTLLWQGEITSAVLGTWMSLPASISFNVGDSLCPGFISNGQVGLTYGTASTYYYEASGAIYSNEALATCQAMSRGTNGISIYIKAHQQASCSAPSITYMAHVDTIGKQYTHTRTASGQDFCELKSTYPDSTGLIVASGNLVTRPKAKAAKAGYQICAFDTVGGVRCSTCVYDSLTFVGSAGSFRTYAANTVGDVVSDTLIISNAITPDSATYTVVLGELPGGVSFTKTGAAKGFFGTTNAEASMFIANVIMWNNGWKADSTRDSITVNAPTTYTVTYNGNNNTGGSAPTDNNSYTNGQNVTTLGQNGMTRTGYTFLGWNTASDGSGTNRDTGSVWAMGSANVTLYARWQINTYTVTYNGNGNTGGSAPTDGSSPYNYGATVTTLGNTGSLVRTGYTFNNWNTSANGSGTSRAPSSTWSMPASNITLYAQWAVVADTILILGNSNSAGYGTSCSYSCSLQVRLGLGNNYFVGPFEYGVGTYDDEHGAVSGENASEILGRCRSYIADYLSPTTTRKNKVLIMAGTNDVNNDADTLHYPAVINSIEAMIDTIKSYNDSLVPVIAQIPPINASQNSRVIIFNRLLKSMLMSKMVQYPDIRFAHVYDSIHNVSGWASSYYDELHPGEGNTGHEAGAFYAAITASVGAYSVVYNGNSNTGGAVPTDGNRYESGDPVIVLGNTGSLVRTEYVWTGWNTETNGSGTHYDATDQFNIGAANAVLYAEWRWDTLEVYGIRQDTAEVGDTIAIGWHCQNPENVTVTTGATEWTATAATNEDTLYLIVPSVTLDSFYTFSMCDDSTCDTTTDDSIFIKSATQLNLTTSVTGSGSVNPSGSVAVDSGVGVSIVATSSANYHFVRWVVLSGTVGVKSLTSSTTTCTLHTSGSIRADFRLNSTVNTHITYTGNSLTDWRYSNYSKYVDTLLVRNDTINGFTSYNAGVSGATFDYLISNYSEVSSAYSGSLRNVAVAWEFTNQSSSSTALEALAKCSTYCTMLKNTGYKVVVLGMLPMKEYGSPPEGSREAFRKRVNDSLSSYFNVLTASTNVYAPRTGVVFADYFCDIAANTMIGDSGDQNNTIYYTDSIHLSDSGQHVAAAEVFEAIELYADNCDSSNRYWLGINDTLESFKNWSGCGPILATDTLIMNSGSVSATARSNISVARFVTTSGYSGNLSLSTYSLSASSGVSFDHTGNLTLDDVYLTGASSGIHIDAAVGTVSASSCVLYFQSTGHTETINKNITLGRLNIGASCGVTMSGSGALTFSNSSYPLNISNSSSIVQNHNTADMTFILTSSGKFYPDVVSPSISGNGKFKFYVGANSINCTLPELTTSITRGWIVGSSAGYTGWSVSTSGNINVGRYDFLMTSDWSNQTATFNVNNNIYSGMLLTGVQQTTSTAVFNWGSGTMDNTSYYSYYVAGAMTDNYQSSTWNLRGTTQISTKTVNPGTSTFNFLGAVPITTNGKNLGNVNINSGASTVTLTGDLNCINFTHTSGILSGNYATTASGDVTIAGPLTFYRLILTKPTTRTVTVNSEATLTLSNLTNSNIDGAAGALTLWRASTPGVAFNLNIPSNVTLQYQNPMDCSASDSITTDLTSLDGGNNTNWFYPDNTPPNVTADPQPVTDTIGRSDTMFVAATGAAPITYQWQSLTGGTVANLAGETNDSLIWTLARADSGNSRRCIVSNAYGADTSAWALVRVLYRQTVTDSIRPNPQYRSDSCSLYARGLASTGGGMRIIATNDTIEVYDKTISGKWDFYTEAAWTRGWKYIEVWNDHATKDTVSLYIAIPRKTN